jgi:hypothetical protein
MRVGVGVGCLVAAMKVAGVVFLLYTSRRELVPLCHGKKIQHRHT